MEYQISVKLDDQTNDQIDALSKRFECSRAEAVRRAVSRTAAPTKTTESRPEIVSLLEQILNSLQTLLGAHKKHHAALLATLRIAGQAGICSALVASKKRCARRREETA